MGILTEFHEGVGEIQRENEDRLQTLRASRIAGVMNDMTDVLAQQDYTGDIDTVLLHHLGKDAFELNDVTDRYQQLAKKLEEAKDPSLRSIPVILIDVETDDWGDDLDRWKTRLVAVDVDQPSFSSTRTLKDGVAMDLFSSKLSTVCFERINLIGSCVSISGSVTHDAIISATEDPKIQHELMLREAKVENDGQEHLSGWGIRTEAYNITDRVDQYTEVFVGWPEVEEAILRGLKFNGSELKSMLAIDSFIHSIFRPDHIKQYAPRLHQVFLNARKIEETLGR